MNDCIFCSIVAKKNKAYIVYEDGHTMAFLDVYPSVSGHLMVIPKKHGVTIQDYESEELGMVMGTVSRMTKILEKSYNTNEFTIGINHGEPSGVPHLHVHLLPRYQGDRGGVIQSIVKTETRDKFEEVVKKIKNAEN